MSATPTAPRNDLKTPVLELRGVEVSVAGDVICRNVDLVINEGEKHLLLGPNGSGKSSLMAAIMGVKPFEVADGVILYRGTDITGMDVEERARLGIGLAYQRPPALDGVQVRRLAQAIGVDGRLADAAEGLGLEHLLDRDVNVGFSGGEAKRFEVMKLELQSPSLCLFDEPESGVDLEQVDAVGGAVGKLLQTPDGKGRPRAGLVITHTGFIIDSIAPEVAHLMIDGTIVADGEPREMFTAVRRDGYRAAAGLKETVGAE